MIGRIVICVTYNNASVAAMVIIAHTNFSIQSTIEAYVWGCMGAIFYCSLANLNALGIIEDSCLEVHAVFLEMRIAAPGIHESVSYGPPRVHFYIPGVGDFGY